MSLITELGWNAVTFGEGEKARHSGGNFESSAHEAFGVIGGGAFQNILHGA